MNYDVIGEARQAFADNGSILLQTFSLLPVPSPGRPVLWNPKSPQMLKLSRTALVARVSRNGTKVVYEAADAGSRALIAYDVTTATEITLATSSGAMEQFPQPFFQI